LYCPNCFSHDDPNDTARAPGKGPKAWWDNSSCRQPDFRLPDLGSLEVCWPLLQDRATLLQRLGALRRYLDQYDRSGRLAAWDASRHQAMQ
jgi:hypothetical protein